MILYEGDRIRNKFNRLIARVVGVRHPHVGTFRYTFYVAFEDDAAGERHYARNGPDGTFTFTNADAWEKIEAAPVPMEDTRAYLQALISLNG